jgi:hypothetical protein
MQYKDINDHGYMVLKNFLNPTKNIGALKDYLKNAEKFSDGVINSIPSEIMHGISEQISTVVPEIAASLNIEIASDRFSYSAIRIEHTNEPPLLRKPFNLHQDPKVTRGGVLNWHLDHFSYYLYRDHANWLICYIPIYKPHKHLSNLAIVPRDAVKKYDPNLLTKINGRGAMRFRCVEDDTLDWFIYRFPNYSISVGDWFAIDDFDDKSMGFKIEMDLEEHKVVPELEPFDLLIMRADVIHRTNDAGTDRISIRCDAIPKKATNLNSLVGLMKMSLSYPFMGKKRRYNIKKWLTDQWRKRFI